MYDALISELLSDPVKVSAEAVQLVQEIQELQNALSIHDDEMPPVVAMSGGELPYPPPVVDLAAPEPATQELTLVKGRAVAAEDRQQGSDRAPVARTRRRGSTALGNVANSGPGT